MRFVTTGLTAILILLPVFSALAKTYPPTTAGLRDLVADDATLLPPPYAARLRKQEADWEQGEGIYSKTLCTPTAQQMIQTIQAHIFKTDGYVFDDEAWSASFPLPPDVAEQLAGEAGATSPVELDQNVPLIVAPVDAKAASLNMALESYIGFIWEQAGGPSQTTPTDDEELDVGLDYVFNQDALPGVISIDISLSTYQHGAVHPTGGPRNFNWNIAAGRQVIPEDIFASGSNWQDGVAKAALAAFRQEGYADPGYLQGDILFVDETLADPQYWALLREGLRVETESYEVCGYMCGWPSVVIPWTALSRYLKPGGLVHNS
jgi:hypothetical protein